ncbi:hypothetical protein EIN_250230 [Entamoeba invadens IP1]|uniref:Transmembrane protein n=1 Tax=Entamoeba invadens IP1 TaxID=370355 RepID=A0A0A1UGH9_ENTIV|nr:hypothetical protein EIN_250230 [Entamoeba invadens IP1]ELP94929.1 hypothetical protein EIN_250230 [Entamoeba invadens IP1]|eukprot:XP_004261700.1 hypothetical protein EIN_250230 [Entamoeba invadens IP1]
MGKFVVLPFVSSIFLLVSIGLTITSLPLSWAMANVQTTKQSYQFYLLHWTNDGCKDISTTGEELSTTRRFGYSDTYEFSKLAPSGIVAMTLLITSCVLSGITALYYLLHACGPTQKCLKSMKLNVGGRTWILLVFGIVSLAINIVGMILWLALFFANNISEWLAQSSPNPFIGFYIELGSIVVAAFGILIGMFWKHS